MQPADWVRLALPGVIWGSSFYFIAEGLDSFEPALITPLRVLFGLATLLAFPAARAPIDRGDRARVAMLGVVWLAVPLTLFPFAEEHVSSSVTGMLNGATPLFVATVATIIARRPPPGRQLVGLFVGFAGVVVIALPSLDKGSSSALGVAMIFAALACYGVALNVARPLLLRYGPLPVMCRAQAVALVLTAPFGIAVLPESSFSWHSARSPWSRSACSARARRTCSRRRTSAASGARGRRSRPISSRSSRSCWASCSATRVSPRWRSSARSSPCSARISRTDRRDDPEAVRGCRCRRTLSRVTCRKCRGPRDSGMLSR